MKLKSFFLPVLLCINLVAHAQQPGMDEAAKKALSEYIQIAGLQKSDRISADALSKAKLGAPISHQTIGLDKLREYKSGADPKMIIQKIDRVTYPVLDANGNVLSSIELDKKDGKWQTAELGNTSYLPAFEEVRKSENLDLKNASLIRLPGLNLYFIATEKDNKLQFALLNDKQVGDIPVKRFISAQTALERLVPIALAYNGLPW